MASSALRPAGDRDQGQRSTAGQEPRKRYVAPELVVYGSLLELTRLGEIGAPDGLSGSRPAG
jgi:hypothetical protein